MVRIIFLLIVLWFVIYRLQKANKKKLCAKSFIFINEINSGATIEEANYRANIFDFLDNENARNVFYDAKKEVKRNYNNKRKLIIERAKNWGFVDTHTVEMQKKRKTVTKILEEYLVIQEAKYFTGNPTREALNIINRYWDAHALHLIKLRPRVCALLLLLYQDQEMEAEYCKPMAIQIANAVRSNADYLSKYDIEIVAKWNEILNNK